MEDGSGDLDAPNILAAMRDPILQIMTTSLKASSHMTPHCPVMRALILSHGSSDTKATLPLGTTWGLEWILINIKQTNCCDQAY